MGQWIDDIDASYYNNENAHNERSNVNNEDANDANSNDDEDQCSKLLVVCSSEH